MALKGNQAETHPQVVEAFELFEAGRKTKMHQELDMGHGRIEKRTCFVAPARDWLLAENYLKWKGLKTLVKVSTEVEQRNGKHKGQVARETRYYLSSLEPDAKNINQAVRSHWGIETKLHGVLDVAFKEDQSRVRKENAPENFAILRHIALNKLKNEKSVKRGIKAKRKKAGWDDEYLLKVLLT